MDMTLNREKSIIWEKGITINYPSSWCFGHRAYERNEYWKQPHSGSYDSLGHLVVRGNKVPTEPPEAILKTNKDIILKRAPNRQRPWVYGDTN